MKRSILIILTLLLAGFTNLMAQQSGIVTYQKVVDFGIEPNGNERWDSFIKDLPKTGTFEYSLTFKDNESLFQEDLSKKEEVNPTMQRALGGAARFNPPKVKTLQTYQNVDKSLKMEQVEFMTRNFVVTDQLAAPSWKITSNKKKVLDYVCTGAEMKIGEETVTAWFTAEIPVAFGPDGYHGLPGLILGLEKGGEMLVLASNIELSVPGYIEAPSTGEKIERVEFDKLVEVKIKEWKANGGGAGGGGRGGN